MVTGTISLENWEPRYLNLVRHLVNVPSPAIIDTTLAATPPTILLYPVAYGNAGATAVQVRCTVYMPPPFIAIFLVGQLRPVKDWQRLRGALVMANLEADFRQWRNGYKLTWYTLRLTPSPICSSLIPQPP